MGSKLYFIVSGFVFLLVSLFHILRIVNQWPIIVGPRVIPFWLSYIGGPVSFAYFIWAAWCLFTWSGRKDRGAS